MSVPIVSRMPVSSRSSHLLRDSRAHDSCHHHPVFILSCVFETCLHHESILGVQRRFGLGLLLLTHSLASC